MKKKIETNVDEVTNSTNPDVSFSSTILTPIELDLGRVDLNLVVEKLNQVIRKVNQWQ